MKGIWLLAGIAALAGTSLAFADAKEMPKEGVKVEMVGTLKTGIAAIGGETTGTLISASGASFEVQPPKGVDVEKLDGKKVKVSGTLITKEGVEIRQRTILMADKLAAAGDDDKEGIKVTVVGKVKTGLVAPGGATTGTTISTGGFTWELDLDKDFQKLAEKHKDGVFEAVGTLEVKKPMAAPPRPRWIVTVTSFKLCDPK